MILNFCSRPAYKQKSSQTYTPEYRDKFLVCEHLAGNKLIQIVSVKRANTSYDWSTWWF